jgi:hypothetical protein
VQIRILHNGLIMAREPTDFYGTRWKSRYSSRCRKWAATRLTITPVLFGLTCGRILKELPDGCSYVDDCAWTIPINNLADKNVLATKIRTLLDQIQAVFRKHGMTLDEKKTEIAVIYKANQKRKQWEKDANRWSMPWNDTVLKFNKGTTRWLGFYLDRFLNWRAHIDTCVQRALWKQQQVRRFMAAYGINRKRARTVSWSTAMTTATYRIEVIYEDQQWIVDKIQKVNTKLKYSRLKRAGVRKEG